MNSIAIKNRLGIFGTPDWIALVFILLHVSFVMIIDQMPGQDLLQHMVNIKVLAGTGSEFQTRFFTEPGPFQTYHTFYYLISWISKLFGLWSSFKIFFCLYIVALMASFSHLYLTLFEEFKLRWLLPCTLFVWGPAVMLGLLSFYLAIPVLIWAISCTWRLMFRKLDTNQKVQLGMSLFVLSLLHPMVILCFSTFVSITVLLKRNKTVFKRSCVALAILMIPNFLWGLIGEFGTGNLNMTFWGDGLKRFYGLQFMNAVFAINWSDPFVLLSNIFWIIGGPFRFYISIPHFLVFVLLGYMVFKDINGVPRTFRNVCLVGIVIAYFVPDAIYNPTHLSHVNLRLMGILIPLLIMLVTPSVMNKHKNFYYVLFFVTIFTTQLFIQINMNQEEGRTVQRILSTAENGKILYPIVLENDVEYFGDIYRDNHFKSLQYMLTKEGVSSQFWAKKHAHLPIGFNKQYEMPMRNYWHLEDVSYGSFAFADYLLVRWPTDRQSEEVRRNAVSLKSVIYRHNILEMACELEWCLYRVK